MNTKLITACLVIAAVVAPLTVRAEDGDKDRKHPMAFVKDSVITTKVKAKLAADKMRTLVHIRVDTDANGMVVLTGTAKTQDAADNAVTIARGVEGVTSVQNDIRIK